MTVGCWVVPWGTTTVGCWGARSLSTYVREQALNVSAAKTGMASRTSIRRAWRDSMRGSSVESGSLRPPRPKRSGSSTVPFCPLTFLSFGWLPTSEAGRCAPPSLYRGFNACPELTGYPLRQPACRLPEGAGASAGPLRRSSYADGRDGSRLDWSRRRGGANSVSRACNSRLG